MEQELLDPITYELFDYPISVPCCGRSFDKASLQRCLQTSSLCPLCSTDIRSFDVDNAPKNINISSLVDVYKQQQAALQVAEQKERERHVWSATLIPVLQDIVKKAKFTAKPSVVICAIDYSGSMCSQTMQNQVRAALKHIMSITANTNHAVETMLIEYQSTASILAIKDKSLAEIHALIDRLSAGGGTNFEAAFTQIYKVMDSCDPQKIGSISIIFMTDGENNYSRGSTPQSLLDGFKTSLADHDVCSKHKVPVTVHSVGFGQSCDRNLLESSEEGIFRFAEPSDTSDGLCNKITSLFDLSTQASTVAIGLELLADGARALWPQDIENATVHVDARGQGVFTTFVQASHAATSVKISSAFDNGTIVEISVSNPTTTTKLFDTYIGRLIDDMASELFEMVQDNTHAYTANCKELHLCLLLQRIEKLLQLASSNEVLVSRLEFLKTQVHNLRAGQQVNAGKIADSRFSSRFQIAGACKKKKHLLEQATEKQLKHYSRANTNKQRNEVQQAVMSNAYNRLTPQFEALFSQSNLADIQYTDVDGNNVVHLAAYCGQIDTLQTILNKYGSQLNLETENNDGETAMTLAIKKQGFHKTMAILHQQGAKIPSSRRKLLQQYALNNGYTITAKWLSSKFDGL